MPLRSYKATSPGLRQMTRSTFDGLIRDLVASMTLSGRGKDVRRARGNPLHVIRAHGEEGLDIAPLEGVVRLLDQANIRRLRHG